TATSSTVISATATPRNSSGRSGRVYLVRREPRASLGQLAVLLLQVVQTTDAQERLLRVVVVLALGDLVERLDGLAQRHRRTGDAGERLGHQHVLRQEPLDPARPVHRDLVLFGQLVHTEDGDDVLQLLVLLQDPDDLGGDPVVLLTDDARLEDGRRGRQRVDRREDALLEHRTGQLRGGVQVGERGRRGRVGVVVRRHVDGLHRGDRPAAHRGDSLLQHAHL